MIGAVARENGFARDEVVGKSSHRSKELIWLYKVLL